MSKFRPLTHLLAAILASTLALQGCVFGTGEPSSSPAPTASAVPEATATVDPNATPTPTAFPTDTPVPVRRWVRQALNEGVVTAVAVDPKSDQVVFAGSNGGALHKSLDGGRTWAVLNVKGIASAITVIMIDPVRPETVYAGTAANGAVMSKDSGSRWAPVGGSLEGAHVYTFVPHELQGVYAGTDAGVFKTLDGGATWTALPGPFNPPDVRAVIPDPANPSVVFAGTTTGVQKSLDGGQTWHLVSNGMTDTKILSLAFDPKEKGLLWAGTETGGLYKTTNFGVLWRRSSSGLEGNRVATLLPDIEGATMYAATGAGAFKTTNAFSWEHEGADLTNRNVTSLAISLTGERRLYAGTFGGGLFRLVLD